MRTGVLRLVLALSAALAACDDGGSSTTPDAASADVPANVCGTPGRPCACLRAGFTGYEMCVLGGPVCVCTYPDGGDEGAVDSTAPDVPATPDVPAMSDGSADAGDGGVVCNNDGSVFPTFDQTCSGDGDCVAVGHQSDCCGNSRLIGIRASARAAFDAAESSCRMMFPACGCPLMSPLADDGMRAPTAASVGVRCQTGACFTFVMP